MLSALILLTVSVYLIYSLVKLSRPKNFPPGPTNYPIIGAIAYIAKLSDVTTFAFSKLGEIFGPVTGLYLGNNRVIVINGYEATKEFYSRDEFSHRPNLFLAGFRWGGRMLGVFLSNGRLWKEQRRFTLRHLRDFGFGKTSMEGLIHEEAEACITSIEKSLKLSESDSVIPIHDKFGVSVINILWAIMGGTRYSHDDEKLKKLLQAIQETFRTGNPAGNFVNSYPWLRHFPYFKEQFKIFCTGQYALQYMLESVVEEHQRTRESTQIAPRDLIDVYLDAIKEADNDPNSTFFKDQLVQVLMDLFGAGSESTSNSIAYAVLHMMRNPDCQEKVHQELDKVVGRKRLPSYDDKQKLHYTFAVVTESLRISPVAPVSVMHYNTEDIKFMGYDIPKGTCASVNYTSTNMDKTYWGDPDVFRPERFLDDTGKFSTVKLDHVMGFGAGKRQCLGEPLARMSNFLLFVAVMQRFKFEIVPGTAKPSLTPVDGFTVAPAPFSGKVTVRSNFY